jgi:molybdopterin-containing oxidoreductase family iron-sulfur binding subunit
MDSTRRRFLKIAGLSVLGLGVKPTIDAVAQGGQPEFLRGPEALKGTKWGMVVDQKKCLKAKDGCKLCVDACHTVHNVPQMQNPKHEVKWIWQTPFDHAFPDSENEFMKEYVKENMKGLPFIVLCNHCDNPRVRVCSTKATFRRPDGVVMMDYHRCIDAGTSHGGMPLWGPQSELDRPSPVNQDRTQPRIPDPNSRCCGKMHILR